MRRRAGRKGGSVWAYAHELDDWLAGGAVGAGETIGRPDTVGRATTAGPLDGRTVPSKLARAWPAVLAAIAVAILAAWWVGGRSILSTPDGHAGRIPRSIVWEYSQGKASDAPNGLRFWEVRGRTVWNESFADGKPRNRLTVISAFHFDKTHCDGILLRKNSEMLAFIPDDRCSARYLMAEDIDPDTGAVIRPWFILGQIKNTTY